MLNPSIALQLLQAGNHVFTQTQRSHPTAPAEGHAPLAVVFRCSDDHIASEQLLGQNSGSLIDVRTWGHVVDTGVLATIEYAVGTLKTPLIVVVGHHSCDAMQTAVDSWNNIAMPDDATRAVVEQAMSSLVAPGAGAYDADQLADAHIMQTGVSLLHKSRVIAAAVDARRCAIVCLTTDPANGRVHVCGTLGDITPSDVPLLEAV